MASRGNYKGKALPVPKANSSTNPVVHEAHELTVDPYIDRVSPVRDVGLLHRHLSTSLNENLLQHFFFAVVPHLTWLDDGPCNPWRSLIQPLVHRSDYLRLSISGLAAAHLSATSSDDARSSFFFQINHSVRNETLKILSSRMRLELCADTMISRKDLTDFSLLEMLACTLILCYSELHIPSSTDWGLHLRACCTMVESCYIRSQREEPQDALSRFLIKEVVDLETFGNLAGFNYPVNTRMGMDLGSFLNGNVWTFTALINEISAAERLHSNRWHDGQDIIEPEMTHWHDKLEAAYHRATGMVSSLPECNATQSMFRTIIDGHYYATLVYSYQCLASHPNNNQKVEEYCDMIWHTIQTVIKSPHPAFIHDVFFPLFIVGTQCLNDRERQSQIEMAFMKSISATGFWCNQSALQMLRLFWELSDQTGDGSWIQFARRHKAVIGPFVIF